MIHPDTQLVHLNEKIGFGVTATQLIPKGTITWVLDKLDKILLPAEVEELGPLYRKVIDKYTYRNRQGNYILCWDNARFINHSFHSNCVSTAYEFEIAVRDIHLGEELTDDYGYLNLTEPFDCLPESNTNRKRVMPDDLLQFYEMWDAKLLDTFPLLTAVDQPLWPFLPEPVREKAKAIARGDSEMDSIVNCYYGGP